MVLASPTPEFRLVCAACRWPSPARDPAVKAALVPGIDWARVAAISQRQRVCGLVAEALRATGASVPPETARLFKQRASQIARQNLVAAAELLRLGKLLDEAGIDWIAFKGSPLAIQAYGTLSLKMANDIDILVPEADSARACALLSEAGYVRFSPGPEVGDDQLARWMQVSKESGWAHPGRGLIVELHSRLLANPALLPEATLASPRKRVAIARGIEVPTMGDDLLFPYLFAHGAHHGWFRLKWLADVAALLRQEGAGAPESRYREAVRLGVGRCAAQALLLAHELLGLELDGGFREELLADRTHRRLLRIARACMGGAFEAAEHAGPSARTMLPALLSGFSLRKGLGYKWRELSALAANPVDRATGRLPPALGFLYPVIGGMRWSSRMLGLRS